MTLRPKIAMVGAEFVGTAILSVAVFATAAKANNPFFTALAAGITLGLMVLVIGPLSQSHINPAVTLGLWTRRKIKSSQALVYVLAQVLGGFAAWRLNAYYLGRQLPDIGGSKFDWKVVIAEAIGTFVFTFGIAAAVYRNYEGGQQAATIGGSLIVGILVASLGSNGVLNPAVTIGLRSLSVTYFIGPLVGGVIGMNLYAFLFAKPLVAFTAKTTK